MAKTKDAKRSKSAPENRQQEESVQALGMQDEGREVPTIDHGPDDRPPSREFSPLEWEIIRIMEGQKGTPYNAGELARMLGQNEVTTAMEKLEAAGVLVPLGWRHRVTSESRMKIPLTAEEREELKAAEARIDACVDAIHGKQIGVARDLRIIRDKRLYRETHARFQDYVEERFNRTRDWAYKTIQELEVKEALQDGDNDVETILQTVTGREIPPLAKLKKEPTKMREALRQAEETAKAENRDRTLEDVQNAVASFKPQEKSENAAKPKIIRTVTITGIEYAADDTEDLPDYFQQFARWLRKNPPETSFSIKVGRPKEAGGSPE